MRSTSRTFLSPFHCYVFVKFFSPPFFFFFSFFSFFWFFLFFSHFIFSVLFLVVRRPPIFRGRSFLSQNLEGMCCIYMYIYMCVCVWRLKEDYNLFSVSCSLLFEFAYQTENLPFLLINCL